MESDGSLQEKAHGAAPSGRSKLSLRRKKDNPTQPSSPPPKPTNLALQITSCYTSLIITPKTSKATSNSEGGESNKNFDDSDAPNTKEAPVESLKHCSSNDVEFVHLSEDSEEKAMDERTQVEIPHQAHDGGLGDFYFCRICQKDLTRFNESRRQTHLNRCCDKQEEERLAAAKSKEGQSSPFSCLICERSCKSDNARVTHMKSCAKSKGIAPDRLVHLMRESKKTNESVDSTSSSDVGSSSSSRLEGERDRREEPLQARRSQRLAGQSGERGKPSKGLEVALSRGDDDFTMHPPASRPTRRRGCKRRRDNLQDNYIDELEEEQLRLALAISASMESGGSTAGVYGGGQVTDTGQGKSRKRQKRKNTTAEVVLPLLTVTAEQAQNIIGQRAEEILRHSEMHVAVDGALEGDDCEIPCTPAFRESELGGYYRPPSVMKAGTTVGECNDRDEVMLPEETEEEEWLKQSDETAVKGSDTYLGDRESSLNLTDEVSNPDKETGPMHEDTVTRPREKAEDNEAIPSVDDESEHSETDTHLAIDAAGEQGISFHEDFQDMDYPTLWQLTSEDTENLEHFYVPALVPMVSPVKAEQTRCKVCKVEPCLALSLQAVPTISPIQTTNSSVAVNHEDLAVNQLLSDMGTLVGSSLLSDVQIETQSGSIIPAHAVILAARCPPLRKVIVQSQTTPIYLNFSEYDEGSILSFLQFVYTGSSPGDTDHKTELNQEFYLLLERWYGDRSDEGTDNDSFPVDQRSPFLKSVSTSQLGDSTMAYAGRQTELRVASPSLHNGSSQPPESEVPQSNERAHPVAVMEEESPVIIESNGDSNSSVLGGGKSPTNDLISEAKLTEVKSSVDIHHMDFSPHAIELGPVVEGGGSGHFGDRPGHSSDRSSPELEKDCSLRRQGAGETVRHRLSSELSHPNSHISLSSVDSNEVVICKTPTTPSSPRDRRESSCDLFHYTPYDDYADDEYVRPINEDEREHETVAEGDTVNATETERRVEESIIVESSSGSRNSSSPLESPHLIEKQGETFPNNSLPGYSIPNYSPVDDYSFGSFDEDITPYPSTSFEQAPVEFSPLQLVTPVNDRTVTMVPESTDTVKRKPQDLKTPANYCGVELQTDDDITPMPNFRAMRTPYLKGECARFGVKAMPKKRMIAKLHEIYEHTHPLVDEEGRIVSADTASLEEGGNAKTAKQRPVDITKRKTGRTKKAVSAAVADGGETSTQACGVTELKEKVLEFLKSDKQLYQDILLFKPLELSYFCTKLKSVGITVAKEKLANILDNLCITYTVPRQQRTSKKNKGKIS